MTDQTPRLALPFMSTAQVQKEATFNELAASVDALVQLNILDKDLTVAPDAPADGSVYIVAAGATGTWAGHDSNIAYYVGGWHYLTAQNGYFGWVNDEAKFYRYRVVDGWQPTLLMPVDHLVELLDVDGTNKTTGYVLTWNNTTSKFELQPVAPGKMASLTDTDFTGLADGMFVVWNAEESKFVAKAYSFGAFTSLADAPNSYAGQAGKGVRVNADNTGLEFYTISAPGASKFTQLSDTPATYSGLAGYGIRVRANEEGLEAYIVPTIPVGGATGQALVKTSDTDGDVEWANIEGGGSGGSGDGGATSLAELTDVDETTAPTDKQALVYDAAESKWKPGSVAAVGENVPTVVNAVTYSQFTGFPETLPWTPKVGNYLIVIYGAFQGVSTTAGWTQVVTHGNSRFDEIAVFARQVVIGDTAAINPCSFSGADSATVFEIDGRCLPGGITDIAGMLTYGSDVANTSFTPGVDSGVIFGLGTRGGQANFTSKTGADFTETPIVNQPSSNRYGIGAYTDLASAGDPIFLGWANTDAAYFYYMVIPVVVSKVKDLNDLDDVSRAAPTDQQALIWDDTSKLWVPKSLYPSLTGNKGRALIVNPGETDVEWGTIAGGSGGGGGGLPMLYDLSKGVPAMAATTKFGNNTKYTFSENEGVALNVSYTGVGTGPSIGGFMIPVPSTPTYHVAAMMVENMTSHNYYAPAVGVYNSANGRYQVLKDNNSANASGYELDNFSNPDTRDSLQQASRGPQSSLSWLHIKFDGTKVYYGWSRDGANPQWAYSNNPTTDYLGAVPTHIAFGMYAEGSDNVANESVTFLCVDGDGADRKMGAPASGGASGGTGIPAGGTKGQVLTKIDGTDGNADWETPTSGGGGSAGTGKARYWRLNRLSGFSATTGPVTIAEIAMRATVGGAALAPVAVTASSYYDGASTPQKAFDGDPNTWWSSTEPEFSWIAMDFGVPVTIAEVSLKGRTDNSFQQNPHFGLIEHSDDGAAWTILSSFIGGSQTAGGEVIAEVPPIAVGGSGGSSGGYRVLISDVTITSAVDHLDFFGFDASKYLDYEFEAVDVYGPLSGNAQFQMSTDGASFDAGANYNWSANILGSAGFAANQNGNGANGINTVGLDSVPNGTSFRARLSNPGSSADYKNFTVDGVQGSGGSSYGYVTKGNYRSTSPVKGLRFSAAGGGSITGGRFRMWGILINPPVSSGSGSSGIFAAHQTAELAFGQAPTYQHVNDIDLSFTLTEQTDIVVQFDGLCLRDAGGCRFAVYDNGAILHPSGNSDGNGVPPAFYSYKNNPNTGGGEQRIQEFHGKFVISLAAGAHTIQLYYTDTSSLNNTSFYDRSMSVSKVRTSL